MSKYLIKLGQNSKKAYKIIDTKIKNNVLKSFVKSIFKNKNKILLENLSYWNVEKQEAYFSYVEASMKREQI